MQRLIIFDFDGVIADSELLANAVLAEALSEIGLPMTTEQSLERLMGKRSAEVIEAVEAMLGRPLPERFGALCQERLLARFTRELRLVAGARDYIDAFAHVPRCIASGSSPKRLAHCLDLLGLAEMFAGAVFSASAVPRGKPHPDIFLYAASRMGIAPAGAIVIEDSISGVEAGVAAGMIVIGLLAASHIRDGHAARLAAAGAHHVAPDFAAVAAITRTLLQGAS